MSKKKILRNVIISILLIAAGVVFGFTWNSEKFCIGDYILSALGFPAWSNGTTGTHYSGFIGFFLILIGITIFNYTIYIIQKKT